MHTVSSCNHVASNGPQAYECLTGICLMGIYARMKLLRDYLETSGKTQAQLGAEVGVGQAAISKLCTGRIKPSGIVAYRIEQATGGAVPVRAWFEEGAAA
jgi:DNA-binding XRE family transcriptional regulator